MTEEILVARLSTSRRSARDSCFLTRSSSNEVVASLHQPCKPLEDRPSNKPVLPRSLGDENNDELQPVRRESAPPNTLLSRIPQGAFSHWSSTDSEKSCRGLKEVNPECPNQHSLKTWDAEPKVQVDGELPYRHCTTRSPPHCLPGDRIVDNLQGKIRARRDTLRPISTTKSSA